MDDEVAGWLAVLAWRGTHTGHSGVTNMSLTFIFHMVWLLIYSIKNLTYRRNESFKIADLITYTEYLTTNHMDMNKAIYIVYTEHPHIIMSYMYL